MPNDDDPRQLAALRDLYAGSAISCFSLNDEGVVKLLQGGHPQHEIVAKFCFDLADAMLAERAKRNEK